MAQQDEIRRFESLFAHPSVDDMYKLTPKVFERFVAYVFRRGGYIVKDVAFRFARGVDLELYDGTSGGRRVGGIEVKRFERDNLVNGHIIQHLLGAAAVRHGRARPYLVTTSGFNSGAYERSRYEKDACLLNGDQLCRYITYLQGSIEADTNGVRHISPDMFGGQHSLRDRSITGTTSIAIANNKGGVGKTMTALHLAIGLSKLGKRILLIDMDAQANLTEAALSAATSLTTRLEIEPPHLGRYFTGHVALAQLIRDTPIDNVSLIPAHGDLRLSDTGGAGNPDIELAFLTAVRELCNDVATRGLKPFDFIFFDTPPSMSLYTRVALAAAQYVLIPARPRPSSLAGTVNLLATIQTMDALVGTTISHLGCTITHWEDNDRSTAIVEQLRLLFRERSDILATRIPTDPAIETTPLRRTSRGKSAYDKLAEEVLDHVSNRSPAAAHVQAAQRVGNSAPV
ncbi:MAG TPA: AAA family ATPase [Ktedonobacterales bacterium]|nr:AAA family ATPase [Ktedonobacterales bacterium]